MVNSERSRSTCNEAVEQTAHAIRGSVSNLGGAAASALAQHIEVQARGGTLPASDRTCVELDAELTRLHHALLALTDDHATTTSQPSRIALASSS